MSDKILSIIVPSYNMEKYLPKCLGSMVVASELMEKLDVIVVNDGSKDRTSEIAHEFADKYPSTFRVIDKTNGHYGSCINVALPKCVGTYVRIVDADDYLDSSSFHAYLRCLQCYNDIGPDCVLTDYMRVDEKGAVIASCQQPFEENFSDTKEFFTVARNGYYPAMPGVTYRKSVFEKFQYKQSEGIPYTDNEWITYPFVGVRTIVCHHINLYRYLIGRAGQTMSSAALKLASQTFDTAMVTGWVRNYARMVSFDNELFLEFYRGFVTKELCRMYFGIIFCNATLKDKTQLEDLDNLVMMSSPPIWSGLADARFNRVLPIRYIDAWRNHHSFLIQVLKAYLRLRRFTNCVQNKLR